MIDFDDKIPIYLQIKEKLVDDIISEEFKDGDMIPSIRNICQSFKVNPQTALNAVNELVNENILFKKRGIGIFVKENAREIILKEKIKEFRGREIEEFVVKAKNLGIDKNDLFTVIKDVYAK